MVAAFWCYRSWRWFVPHMIISVASVGGLWFYVARFAVVRQLLAHEHLINWPAGLELARFEVCAIKINERSSETTAPIDRCPPQNRQSLSNIATR
jgi:hypothetical protein